MMVRFLFPAFLASERLFASGVLLQWHGEICGVGASPKQNVRLQGRIGPHEDKRKEVALHAG